MKFSERKGYKKIANTIQSEGMSDELRNSLWNVLYGFFWDFNSIKSDAVVHSISKNIENLSINLAIHYFKIPVDTIPWDTGKRLLKIRNYYMNCQWYEVYDFLAFTLNLYKNEDATEVINSILERELSGYRLINGIITDITDPQEKEMLESALKDDDFPAVKAHLKRALELLSDKKTPDYRNSIKESISAVESLAKVISGNPKATLGDAIKIIEKNGKIHPALKEAFLKLYGYTSDESGIRHAMSDIPDLNPADAKYFLLSCTSFINYLKSKL